LIDTFIRELFSAHEIQTKSVFQMAIWLSLGLALRETKRSLFHKLL